MSGMSGSSSLWLLQSDQDQEKWHWINSPRTDRIDAQYLFPDNREYFVWKRNNSMPKLWTEYTHQMLGYLKKMFLAWKKNKVRNSTFISDCIREQNCSNIKAAEITIRNRASPKALTDLLMFFMKYLKITMKSIYDTFFSFPIWLQEIACLCDETTNFCDEKERNDWPIISVDFLLKR